MPKLFRPDFVLVQRKLDLSIDVNFRIKGYDVTEVLRYLFNVRGVPAHIRSDNGPEFISGAVKKFLKRSGVDTRYVEPGSSWENPGAPGSIHLMPLCEMSY